MREDELYFAYRTLMYRSDDKEGKVVAEPYRVKCMVGSCPVMIDVRADRFICLFHKRKATEEKLSTKKWEYGRSEEHT